MFKFNPFTGKFDQVGNGVGGNFLPLAGGTMDSGAEIVFASDSLLRQSPLGVISVAAAFDDISGFHGQYNIPVIQDGSNGTINISEAGVITISNPGIGYTNGTAIIGGGTRITVSVINGYGLDTVCAANYIHRWENGTLYITDPFPGQKIRVAQYKLTTPPNVNQDESLGYRVGSRYILDDGTEYLCTDATVGDAVWQEVGGGKNISDPNVAYVRSDGSDVNGVVGNPHKPYANGTAAYNDGARSFDFGVGSFEIITNGGVDQIFVKGRGINHTTVAITHKGENGTIGTIGESSTAGGSAGGNGSDGSQPGDLSLNSDNSVTINLLAIGGDGGDGGKGGDGLEGSSAAYGGSGGNGGQRPLVTLYSVIGTVDIRGGVGGSVGATGSGSAPGGASPIPGNTGAELSYGTAYLCNVTGPNKAYLAIGTIIDNVFYANS